MVCTDPLPKVVSPSTKARSQSCRAPATISEAEALPWFTSTTMGIERSMIGSFSERASVC